MNQLEFLHEQDLKKPNFLPRKVKIGAKKPLFVVQKNQEKVILFLMPFTKEIKKSFYT